MRTGGRRVYPMSLASLVYTLGSVRGRWVHWGRHGGRRVRPGSMSSLGCALEVVGFVQGY